MDMAAFVKEFKNNEEFYLCQREDRLVGFPRTAQVSSTSVAVRTFTKRALFQETQKKRGQVTNAKCKARKGYGGQTCLGLSETTRWASVSIGGGSRTCGIEEESRRLHCWGATHCWFKRLEDGQQGDFFQRKERQRPHQGTVLMVSAGNR